MICSSGLLGARADDLGRAQQLGTNGQSGSARRIHIDAQANPAIFVGKLDHDAALRRAVRLGDRQRAVVVEQGKNLSQARNLGLIDEEDLAVVDLGNAAEAAHGERVPVDPLVVDRLVQVRAEGIAADDADDKGLVGRGECLRRPLDETREIEQKDGLNLIFGRRIGGAQVRRDAEAGDRHQQQPQLSPQ